MPRSAPRTGSGGSIFSGPRRSSSSGCITRSPTRRSGASSSIWPRRSPNRSRRSRKFSLFHRNAFRQVAGLVYVGAFKDGDVVGEELDRDRVKEGGDKRVAIRYGDAEGEP